MQVLIAAAPKDSPFADWLHRELQRSGHASQFLLFAPEADVIEQAVRACRVVLLVLSPHSVTWQFLVSVVALAQHHHKRIIPLQIAHLPDRPEFVRGLPIVDLTALPSRQIAAEHVLHLLSQHGDRTFGAARDAYLQRATLKAENTIAAYRRSIELFLDFLGDPSQRGRLPIHGFVTIAPDDTPLNTLSAEDAPIFLHFAEWMLSAPSHHPGDKRPYKVSTVELRLAGVQNWFQFMDDHGWLPAEFRLAKARRIVRDELRSRSRRSGPPQPPDHIEELIYYFDQLRRPPHLDKPDVDPERVRRWELTRLRNRALLHALAETGGRISEILSLDVGDFPIRYLERGEVLRVEVRAKGGHTYQLRFLHALPAIKAYLDARGADLRASTSGRAPLFVSHDPRFDGNRMSRVIAWRVVQRAARALGLKSISPHDFRHWRATQLINAGTPLDVVQDYLGHRSVETTRAYYAHTDPLRVDDAARQIGLPRPEDEE